MPRKQKRAKLKSISTWFVVDDVIASAEHYRDKYGFGFNNFFGDPPVFVLVRRGAAEIGLSQTSPDKRGNCSNTKLVPGTYDTYIRVDDIAALEKELRASGADIMQGPIDRVYQMREIIVRDLNGYVLCFGQDLIE